MRRVAEGADLRPMSEMQDEVFGAAVSQKMDPPEVCLISILTSHETIIV